MAKAYQITRFVCLLVVRKTRKPDYVMYVQLLSVFFFGYVAALTSVFISLSNISTLPLPVWAVVPFVIASFPTCIIFARVAYVSAFGRAKPKPSSPFFFCGKVYSFAAFFANEIDARFSWGMGDYNALLSGFFIARLRAKWRFSPVLLKRLSVESSRAVRASVLRIYSKFFSPDFVGARTATSCLPSPFQAFWISVILGFAHRANSIDHKIIIP